MALTTESGLKHVRAFVNRGSRDLRLLAISTMLMSFGFGAYNATFNNFAVQSLGITPRQLGILEAFRETPGFFMVVIAGLTMTIAEPLLASAALLLVAIGLSAYKISDSYASLVIYSVIWSVGLHAWMAIQPSMTLNLANKHNRGRRLGQIGSFGALGMILGMLMVFWWGKTIGFRNVFVVAGVFIAMGAVFVSRISKDIGHAEKPKFVFKRRYLLYYCLTFLEGCRKQIFITFAIFAMVRNYHTPVHVVALLMILNNIVNLVLTPPIGRLIDRVGERKVLAICYAALIPVFLGYAFIKIPLVLYMLYCLDNLFYIGSMGSTTYLHKIADPEDVMPSIAAGISINHGAAVAVPLIGGLLWAKLGYSATFFGGAVVVAISLLTVLQMKLPVRVREMEPALVE